jgi:hypothetical protein
MNPIRRREQRKRKKKPGSRKCGRCKRGLLICRATLRATVVYHLTQIVRGEAEELCGPERATSGIDLHDQRQTDTVMPYILLWSVCTLSNRCFTHIIGTWHFIVFCKCMVCILSNQCFIYIGMGRGVIPHFINGQFGC